VLVNHINTIECCSMRSFKLTFFHYLLQLVVLTYSKINLMYLNDKIYNSRYNIKYKISLVYINDTIYNSRYKI
jgi:hypothetical protein